MYLRNSKKKHIAFFISVFLCSIPLLLITAIPLLGAILGSLVYSLFVTLLVFLKGGEKPKEKEVDKKCIK